MMTFTTSVPTNALISSEELAATAAPEQFRRAGGAQKVQINSGTVDGNQVARPEKSVVSAYEQAPGSMRLDNTFTNNPRSAIQWPFPYGVPIRDGYGPRRAPTAGASTFHLGADFDPGAGTPIQSIAAGVVQGVTGSGNSCGVTVTIDHVVNGAKVTSVYCHLQAGTVRVTPGQRVGVADIVGLVGNTGVSTGAHLHLEIRLNGSTPVDPIQWLRANVS